MNKRTMTPTEDRQEQENETNEILLAEDVVQTSVYLANAGLLFGSRAARQYARNAGS